MVGCGFAGAGEADAALGVGFFCGGEGGGGEGHGEVVFFFFVCWWCGFWRGIFGGGEGWHDGRCLMEI